mgnify:CR=1 FL=1
MFPLAIGPQAEARRITQFIIDFLLTRDGFWITRNPDIVHHGPTTEAYIRKIESWQIIVPCSDPKLSIYWLPLAAPTILLKASSKSLALHQL